MGGVIKEFYEKHLFNSKLSSQVILPHFVTVKFILIAKECKYKNTYANTNGYCHEINYHGKAFCILLTRFS